MINNPLLSNTQVYPSSYLRASARKRAWRNLMVCAVNAGFEQHLFSLKPDGNYWQINSKSPGVLFSFVFPSGHPARGWCGDAGFGELSFHAAVNPIDDRVRGVIAGSYAGDSFGQCWLDRSNRSYLKTASYFYCSRELLEPLAAISVSSTGYRDRS